jgi:UDP-N-acetylglucosamine--N-acetylmuramyl-(pentapeptide) pyrophosphoryl-undecaprenol N-acetylglucosamine transferase
VSELRYVLLAAGGTGGHILPAVTFGEWVGRNHPSVRVAYMSGKRRLELDIYRTLKIEPFVLSLEGSPIGAPRGKKLRRWTDLFRSFRQAGEFMSKERPDLCVVFGGYISLAAVFSAYFKKIPMIAHEQNALAGRVTKAANLAGARVAAGWDVCNPFAPGGFTTVGVPVRPLSSMSAGDALWKLGLQDKLSEGPTVAVMTGSLGSGNLDSVIKALSGFGKFASWNFLIIDPNIENSAKTAPNVIRVPRSWDIAPLFNLADILLTRGGGSTLAEADASGIPTIVVPWRGAAGDHQMQNALAFIRRGKVGIWDENNGTVSDLADKLLNMHRSYPSAREDIGEKMYNASISICERFWDFCCAFWEGRD